MGFGIDYSYGSGLTAPKMKKEGVTFVARYLATLPNSKCINKAEADNLIKAGIRVVLVWETTADRVLSGHGGGVADAKEADRQASSLGMKGIPIYFACDFDSTEAQQGPINAYCDGVAGVIGRKRTGLYGGYWPVKRAFDAKKITYGWQTYAWSGGNWDKRAQLQQYKNGVKMGPAEVDYDRSMDADYGQWPRPSAPKPPPDDPPGVKRADGKTSLGEYAQSRNYATVWEWLDHQKDLSAKDAEHLVSESVPPSGTVWHVNP